MAVNLSPVAGVAGQLFDNNGDPLTGGKVFTYAAGTTTNQTTYTNASGSVPHSNPIILDAAGRVPGGEIWLTDGSVYKFVITDSTNVLIGTYDNISGINSNFVNFTNQQEIQTATAGQTVFTLTTTTYQPGTNSLSVFVDGVNQYGPGALYAYLETNSTTVTFVTGLHVGAEVKFTTSQLNSTAGSDATLVSYLPPFTGSVATNVAAKLAQTISVIDFGAVGNGVADDTAAFQAAIDYASILGNMVFIPAGDYIITDTINMPSFTGLIGEHNNTNAGGYGNDTKSTRILFQPTTAKSLFVASGAPPYGPFRSGYYLEGLYIGGNSATSSGNSIYAIDVDSVTDSSFKNLAIENFRTGIRCFATINNRFEYVRVIFCYEQCVLYDGGIATTDTWEQCYLSNAPIGVQTVGQSLGIKFSNCIFETIENYGVNINKECYGWSFDCCYAENIPTVSNVNAAMFRVGYDGTTPVSTLKLTVIGGIYGGSNVFPASAGAGNWLDCDFSTGVYVSSVVTSRFYYSIRATANTTNGSIVVNGLNAIQQFGIATGITNKVQGALPNGLLNSGTLGQNAFYSLANTNRVTAYDGNGSYIDLTGAIIRINPGAGNQVYPVTDNAVSFGTSGNRWSRVYATTYYAGAGVAGVSGTFTTVDSKTVTVTNGIITGIV